MRLAILVSCFFVLDGVCFTQTPDTSSRVSPDYSSSVSFVTSKDGTRIAVECAGKGPKLLIVHGGTGDRRRWQPLLPLFASQFTVCAMDRRGHGQSEPGSNYSLEKEFADVAAVVNALSRGDLEQREAASTRASKSSRTPTRSLKPSVFVLGHSIGGVCALEAAFMTNKISRLVLYEPPLQDLDHTAVADRMEKMIQAGDREQALLVFLSEIVMLSPKEIEVMKAIGRRQ